MTDLNQKSEESSNTTPTSLYIAGVTASSLTLSWGQPAGTFESYRLVYALGSTAPESCSVGTPISILKTEVHYVVTGLLPVSTYSFRLCTVTDSVANSISEGNFVSGTTLIALPNEPSSFIATPNSFSQINLNWLSGGGSTIGYRIAYQTGSTAPANCASGTQVAITGAANVSHQVTGLAAGTQYSFRLCSINGNLTPDMSAGVLATATTTQSLPPNPTGLSATATSDVQINLSWTSGGGSTIDYRISYAVGATAPANCSSGTQISEASVTGTSHSVNGLTATTQYSFRVCAINSNAPIDVSSGVAATATTLATPQAPPPNPSGLMVSLIGDTSFSFLWSSGGGTTADYRISYAVGATPPATCADGTLISEADISGTSHTLTGLTANTQYSFRLCAINGNATPDVSSGITSNLTTLYSAPPNPTGLAATPANSSTIVLSWTSGGGSTSDYRISYATGGSAPATCAAGITISESSVSGTLHTLNGFSPSSQYSFRVCAINANGTPDVSSGATATATTLQAAPPDITSPTVTPSATSALISWTSGGGSTVDYRISYQTGATAPATCALGTTISESSISGTSHSITGLTENTQYSYRICAINGNTTPDVSSGVTGTFTTPYSLPPNPNGLAATPGITNIDLSWTSGGGSTVDYIISYASGATAPATCAAGTVINAATVTGASHSVTGLTTNTQYSFRVCAINANGTPDVSSGVTLTSTTLQVAPPNPTGLTAEDLSDSQIDLSWVSGGGTTADYRISYSTGATAPATCAAGTTIGEAFISGTANSVTDLTQNTQYSFRVCAINSDATPAVSSGVTITISTKSMPSALRVVHTSTGPNKSIDIDQSNYYLTSSDIIYAVINGKIAKYDSTSGVITTLAMPGGYVDTIGITYVMNAFFGGANQAVFTGYDYVDYSSKIYVVNTSTDTVNIVYSASNTFITLFDNYLYFGNFDNTTNRIYRSLGTSPTTELVASLSSTTQIQFLGTANNKLFVSYDSAGTWDYELYSVSTGATATVTALSNFCPAASCGGVQGSVGFTFNNELFFTGFDGANIYLSKSNGTIGGTVHVSNITDGVANAYVDRGSYFLFTKWWYGGTISTYRSDGTGAGTSLISSSANFSTSGIAVGGTYYFIGMNASYESALWRTDGTGPGTVQLDTNVVDGAGALMEMDGSIYYLANNGAIGTEIYKYSISSTAVSLVKDLRPGAATPFPTDVKAQFTKYDSTHFMFSAYDGLEVELMTSDGTSGGTGLLKNINDFPSGSSFPKGFRALNGGGFIFLATSKDHGTEFWKTDGSAAGTVEIADSNSGELDTDSWGLLPMKGNNNYSYSGNEVGVSSGNIVPFMYTHPFLGLELHAFNLTTESISMVFDMNPGFVGNNSQESSSSSFHANTFFYLPAPTPYWWPNGWGNTSVWATDGTLANTVDTMPGVVGPMDEMLPPRLSINTTDVIIPNAAQTADVEFYVYDTLTKVSRAVSNVCPGNCGRTGWGASSMIAISATKFMYSDFDGNVFVSDGTDVGTTILNTNLTFANLSSGVIHNGKFLFIGGINGVGFGMVATDGTSAGTTMVKNVWPTWVTGDGYGNFEKTEVVKVGNTVYLWVMDYGVKDELWKTDGTGAGTTLIKSFTPTVQDHKGIYPIANDTLDRIVVGVGPYGDCCTILELWLITPATSTSVKLMDTSLYNSPGFKSTVVGNKLIYFVGDKLMGFDLIGLTATELNNTNGGGSERLCFKGNRLYFRGYTSFAGHEIWYTDGSAAGTAMWSDENAGPASSNFNSSMEVNGKCYFWGRRSSSGKPQLFSLDF